MAITKAEILTVLNARLNRAETDIDEEIRSALYDLSNMANWKDLWTSDTTNTLTAGDTYLSLPDNFKELDAIVLNDGSEDGEPLKPLVGGFREWLRRREGESSSDYDEPEYYVIRGKRFYLDPVSDDNDGNDYTATIYFWRTHPNDLDNILFGEQFREAIYNKTIAVYLQGLGLAMQASDASKLADALASYGREVNKLIATQADYRVAEAAYNDI